MKVSVSLPDSDVAFLDAYAKEQRVTSRSAVVHRAVELLRATQLGAAYQQAWAEWEASGDPEAWDVVVGDGLGA